MTTKTTKPRDWRRMVRSVIMMAALLCSGLTARAADYVFTYNGGYLAVDNSGNIIYTTTLSPQCVWTCVSSATNLTASTLSGTSRYLYTTDENGTRRWLIGSTTNGAAITTSTNAGTARWRANGTRLYWRNGGDYYAYYRDNTWRTSNSSNGNSNGVNAYMSGNNSGTDYRLTLYQVTVSTVTSTSSGPTINGADVLTATGNSAYTATGASYSIGYTNYYFNSANHYVDADGNSFTGTPANATITNTWSLTDNAYATVNSTSGVVTVTSLPEYDIILTLTVTATATGGTPAAPANTTLTGTKQITIQGTKPSAPIISVSGNSATLTTDAAGSTTIRYTLDGSDPTASTGTVYSGAIDLLSSATSPVTIKAVTVRNGNASEVSSEVVTLTLPEPTITINGEAKTATIASSIAGATIYYTTDGTTPTTSSSQYTSTISGLSYMTTVKAIAVKDGWNDSPVASGIVTIPSGVGGGVVTLFDYEPHSWSYYGDPDCPIHSLNPADVKITYYGDGIVMSNNNDYTAGTSNYVSPGNANYVGGAKVNVGGEDENTFVYYKTLERTDGSTSANPTGRCLYTTIPNPFQVRPTYGSRGTTDQNTFTGWRGFQCWRLKSVTGGSVYSDATGVTALATGAIINGEADIYFAPNSEYGMEVELEAVWARAYVVKGDQGTANNILAQNVGVERNFLILTAAQNYRFDGTSGRYIGNKGYAATISRYYPNGETGNTSATVSGYNDMTLGADTKFENITFNSMGSYTLTAAGHNLIVGRGCSGTVGTVQGFASMSANLDYTIRVESGTITTFYATGNTNTANNYTLTTKTILGCDYDRASTTNNKLTVGNGGNIYGGQTICISSSSNRNNLTFDWLIKSGTYNDPSSLGGGDGGNESIYLGSSQAASGNNALRYIGKRRLVIEGGNFASIAGGMNSSNQNTTSNSNNFSASVFTVNDGFAVDIRVKGGTINGSIYGAAAFAGASGDRRIVVTGGKVYGWIAGGANGTRNDGGEMYGDSYVYVGGASEVGNNSGGNHVGKNTGSSYGVNGADGGNVFGAGCGILPHTGSFTNGTVGRVNNSTIVVADEAHVWRDVHGGGNYGWVRDDGTSSLYILGNCIIGGNDGYGNVFGGSNNQQGQEVSIIVKGGDVKGGVYGGSHSWGTINDNVTMNISGGLIEQGAYGGGYGTNSNSCDVTGTVDITMTGGTVLSGLYGGGNVNSTISNAVTIQVDGGQVGTPESNANIHGGGYGSLTAVTGNVSVTLGASTSAADSATVNGNVFGGSALGRTNTGNTSNTTTVTMNKALINGNLFGGALGNGATVTGRITVNVNGGRVNGNVFGGGDAAAYSHGGNFPVVNMTGGQVTNIFGGGRGNSATVTGNPQVTLSGNAHVTGNVYGGGDAAEVRGHTNVQLRD